MDPSELAEVLQSAAPHPTALPAVLADLGFELLGQGSEASVYASPDGKYVAKCFKPANRARAAEEHRLLVELGGLDGDRPLPSGRRLRTPDPFGVVADAGVVMEERVQGVSLGTWLRSVPRDEAEPIADDVLAAAERCFAVLGHKYGDFNPWNLFLADGCLVLLDPGLPSGSTFQVERRPGVVDDICFWVNQVASNAHRLRRVRGHLRAQFDFSASLLARYIIGDRDRYPTLRQRVQLVGRIVRSVISRRTAKTGRLPGARDLFLLAEGGLVSLAIGISALRRARALDRGSPSTRSTP